MAERTHFVVIVAGENPTEIIKKYDKKKTVEPYVVARQKNAKELHEHYLKYYEELLKRDLDEDKRRLFQSVYDSYKAMDDINFYIDFTSEYELDPETGDAISRENPDGKYDSCNIACMFAKPLIIEGEGENQKEIFSAKKGDIDWSKIHLANTEIYEAAWEMVMENRKPVTEEEKLVYENMKERKDYFSLFGDEETYVITNTAFQGYAFLSEATGWVEIGETESQFDWCKKYFDEFIKPLSDDTLITVMEFTRYD